MTNMAIGLLAVLVIFAVCLIGALSGAIEASHLYYGRYPAHVTPTCQNPPQR